MTERYVHFSTSAQNCLGKELLLLFSYQAIFELQDQHQNDASLGNKSISALFLNLLFVQAHWKQHILK